jgi:hypothetical protein
LGVPAGRACGEAVRLASVEVVEGVALGSGVLTKFGSLVVGGVLVSGCGVAGAGATLAGSAAGFFGSTTVFFGSAAGLCGRASCEDMIAGSTGAPLTVLCPVGGRRAGGVYLLDRSVDANGGKSDLSTPLYLFRH